MEETEVWVIVCFWSNIDGCGVKVEGVYSDHRTALSDYIPLQKDAEKWNVLHPECLQHYVIDAAYVRSS